MPPLLVPPPPQYWRHWCALAQSCTSIVRPSPPTPPRSSVCGLSRIVRCAVGAAAVGLHAPCAVGVCGCGNCGRCSSVFVARAPWLSLGAPGACGRRGGRRGRRGVVRLHRGVPAPALCARRCAPPCARLFLARRGPMPARAQGRVRGRVCRGQGARGGASPVTRWASAAHMRGIACAPQAPYAAPSPRRLASRSPPAAATTRSRASASRSRSNRSTACRTWPSPPPSAAGRASLT